MKNNHNLCSCNFSEPSPFPFFFMSLSLRFLIIILSTLSLPLYAWASQPVTAAFTEIDNLTCPAGREYQICGWVNATLHNKFVEAMKAKNIQNAIKYWDLMQNTINGANAYDILPIENYLSEPLFGTLEHHTGATFLPTRIIAKKSFRWGILTLGTNCFQDCDFSWYYVSYMKPSNSSILYVANKPLVPTGSSQHQSYSKLYSDFREFENDLKKSFQRGRFNNKSVDAVYKNFLRSVGSKYFWM